MDIDVGFTNLYEMWLTALLRRTNVHLRALSEHERSAGEKMKHAL